MTETQSEPADGSPSAGSRTGPSGRSRPATPSGADRPEEERPESERAPVSQPNGEVEQIYRAACEAERRCGIRLNHLRNRVGLANYVEFADRLAETMRQGGGRTILDWGCGFGHMSWLMRNRGLEVTSYDLLHKRAEKWRGFLDKVGQKVTYGKDRTKLLFDSGAFDAVLSCGVLEHVPDEPGSLREIRRVLRPTGLFFIFMLPNLYSYTEVLNHALGHGGHDRRYTRGAIRELLSLHGFELVDLQRGNAIPKNLTGLPSFLHRFYDRFAGGLVAVDRALVRLPAVGWASGVFHAVARRSD